MPLTSLAADAFGAVTIALVCLVIAVGIFCIYRLVYFQLRIRVFPQLSFFNGPWIIRIALVLVSILWGLGEIIRLTLLRGSGRPFFSLTWQKDLCKFYIVSNLGFAEPVMFLILAFLLHASLQNREAGTLSQRWNMKTIGYIILLCLPIFVMQLVLITVGPKYNSEEKANKRKKMAKFFISNAFLAEDDRVCTYPLLSTIFLGFFYVLLLGYITYVGSRMLSLVLNKGLRRRVYVMILSAIFFLPLRMLLLGFSVLPRQGNLAYEAIVFSAFLMLFLCTMVGISMLVYFPVADSLALGDLGHIEIEQMPYDDYYYDGVSHIANQSYEEETGGNSDASAKRGSVSFRTMIKNEPAASVGIEEVNFFPHGSLSIV